MTFKSTKPPRPKPAYMAAVIDNRQRWSAYFTTRAGVYKRCRRVRGCGTPCQLILLPDGTCVHCNS